MKIVSVAMANPKPAESGPIENGMKGIDARQMMNATKAVISTSPGNSAFYRFVNIQNKACRD